MLSDHLCVYTPEDLKCRFYSTKKIFKVYPLQNYVNYEFIVSSNTIDLVTFFFETFIFFILLTSLSITILVSLQRYFGLSNLLITFFAIL